MNLARRCRWFTEDGEGGLGGILYQPPGENITYGALQNTRFQAADRPETQRRTLTERQEKGIHYLNTGTVYHSLQWNVMWKSQQKHCRS